MSYAGASRSLDSQIDWIDRFEPVDWMGANRAFRVERTDSGGARSSAGDDQRSRVLALGARRGATRCP